MVGQKLKPNKNSANRYLTNFLGSQFFFLESGVLNSIRVKCIYEAEAMQYKVQMTHLKKLIQLLCFKKL